MLFLSARSLSESSARDLAGSRTSNDARDFEASADNDPSAVNGVGFLLVAGVEYSASEDSSCGVAAEETDVLPIPDALPRRGLTPL